MSSFQLLSTSITPAEFGKFGELKDVYIPKDYHTGVPKDFGFVEYWETSHAEQAIAEMDGVKVNFWRIFFVGKACLVLEQFAADRQHIAADSLLFPTTPLKMMIL